MIDTLCDGNKSEFCRRIGKPVTAVKDIVGGKKTAPSYDLLYAILESDLGISPSWLMMGEGGMMKSATPSPSPSSSHNDIHHNETVNINYGALKDVIVEAIKEATK